MVLPIARKHGAGSNISWPDAEAVKKCFEFRVTNIKFRESNILDYVLLKLKEKAEETKNPHQFDSIIDEGKLYIEKLKLQSIDTSTTAWERDVNELLSKTPFAVLQSAVAAKAVSELVPELNEAGIRMDYAITENSEFFRAFSVNGEVLESQVMAKLDAVFNAYLADKGITNVDGVLYAATDDGQKQLDDKGNAIKVSPEEVEALISNGFQDYLEKQQIEVERFNKSEYEVAEVAPQEEVIRADQEEFAAPEREAPTPSSEKAPRTSGKGIGRR